MVSGGFEVVRFSWFHGEAEPVEFDGMRGMAIAEPQAIDRLPGEFFNRELQDIATALNGPDTEAELCDFVSRWGIPYTPVRYMQALPSSLIESMRLGGHVEIMREWTARETGLDFDSPYFGECASLAEIAAAITYLAEIATDYVDASRRSDAVNAADGWLCARVVNECTKPPELLSVDGFTVSTTGYLPSLTNAICAQIIEHEQDPAPWRLCACEGCGRWFKRRRGNARYQQGDVDSRYCSAKCNNRQRQRNKRKRERR